MGAVYLARDTHARLVAIKVVLPQDADPEACERFRREIQIIARFVHPNIIPMFVSGSHEGMDYFVMPYIAGDSVAERLKQDGQMPAEEVRRVLLDVADALYYAHGLGVIHRDVKPANVMIDDSTRRAMLTDFGISRTLTTFSDATGASLAGTIGYMPPEAFAGACPDHRGDIYAVGVLGYEMLTGRPPFNGKSALETVQQTMGVVPSDVRVTAPETPPDLAGVIMSCLEKDPSDRPRDARLLGARLGAEKGLGPDPPDVLLDMAGFGSWTVLWVCVWGTFGVLKLDSLLIGIVLLVIAMIVPTGFALQVAGMSPAKHPVRQIARVAFWPPKWWGMWWPRHLRRPADLWRRLPVHARMARVTLSACLVIVPVLIFLVTENDWILANLPPLLPAVWVVTAGLAAGVLGTLGGAWTWAKHRGLNSQETVRFLIGPTVVSQFWDLPQVSARLTDPPPLPPSNEEEPQFPRDCLHKIQRIAAALEGQSHHAGAMALGVARLLSQEIEALDVEASELRQRHDPDELVRLEELLSQHVVDDGDDSPWRQSIVRDLDAQRAIGDQLDAVIVERASLFDTMKSLWKELLALSRLNPDDGAAKSSSARIRRICDRLR
jgi:hypothetical protein